MAKRILISALPRTVRGLGLMAARKALEDIADVIVTDAQNLAPVRQSFKNSKGQKKRTRSVVGTDLDVGTKGRGSRMLIHRRDRNPLNKLRGTHAFVLGKTDYYSTRTLGEVRRFHPKREKGVGSVATVTTRPGEMRPNRGGRGGHRETLRGFTLNSVYDKQLTSRARYNIARGIGIHKMVVGSEGGSQYVLGGALRDSIHVTDIEMAGHNSLQFELRASVRYAPYVEFGTYKDYAQPFMRPAIKNAKRKFRGKIKDHFREFGFEVRG